MKKAAKVLVGKHDFSSFTSEVARQKGKEGKELSAIRTIRKFTVKRSGFLVLFSVEADGFLYHMVRNLVGTLLEVGWGKLQPGQIQKILTARNRRKNPGATIPSTGLTLITVKY